MTEEQALRLYRALSLGLEALCRLDMHNKDAADWLREELDSCWAHLDREQTSEIEGQIRALHWPQLKGHCQRCLRPLFVWDEQGTLQRWCSHCRVADNRCLACSGPLVLAGMGPIDGCFCSGACQRRFAAEHEPEEQEPSGCYGL